MMRCVACVLLFAAGVAAWSADLVRNADFAAEAPGHPGVPAEWTLPAGGSWQRVVGADGKAVLQYEAAAGVRLDAGALATRDIDLLWDTRKRITFSTQLARVDSSMLGVLKKVDPTFRMRQSQKYTAVNKDGFEVDIIRRERTGDDPHPIKLSDADDDFWVAQARRANVLLDAPGFSAVIVATNGAMARMHTVHPATLVAFKRWMAAQPDRDALKRRRDVLQADAVQATSPITIGHSPITIGR